MQARVTIHFLYIIIAVFATIESASAHEIIFCGEKIPVEKDFVAGKLMNVIRRQIPNVNLPQLRKRADLYFPTIEYYLHATGLPEDLKYVPIVESAFENITSEAGAKGIWQFMDETAKDKGLNISPGKDDRDNLYKSTYAACKLFAEYYLQIKRTYGISSWVLTLAAYNFGIGNMSNAISKQGHDYFSMNLNPETAMYVYKIIAVKELFEYPELYIHDFGYNVFNAAKTNNQENFNPGNGDTTVFNTMVLNVSENDGLHPDNITVKEYEAPVGDIAKNKSLIEKGGKNYKYIGANVKGKYKEFIDGQLIDFTLQDDLEVNGGFIRKGNIISGTGWLIGERIFIDLGYSDHQVELLDINGQKGIDLSSLKNKEIVLLKVVAAND